MFGAGVVAAAAIARGAIGVGNERPSERWNREPERERENEKLEYKGINDWRRRDKGEI